MPLKDFEVSQPLLRSAGRQGHLEVVTPAAEPWQAFVQAASDMRV